MPHDVNTRAFRHAVHEAGHGLATYLHGGRVECIRLGQNSCCEIILPGREDPEQKAAISALVDLAGLAAEEVVCGALADGIIQSDLESFERNVKATFIWGWGLPTAKAAFARMAETLLRHNDRTLWHLAQAVEGRRHVYGQDCMLALAEGKKWFGISQSPLLARGWRDWLEQELADQRAMEKLAAREEQRIRAIDTKQLRTW